MKKGEIINGLKIVWSGQYFVDGICMKCGTRDWFKTVKVNHGDWVCQKCGDKGVPRKKPGRKKGGVK